MPSLPSCTTSITNICMPAPVTLQSSSILPSSRPALRSLSLTGVLRALATQHAPQALGVVHSLAIRVQPPVYHTHCVHVARTTLLPHRPRRWSGISQQPCTPSTSGFQVSAPLDNERASALRYRVCKHKAPAPASDSRIMPLQASILARRSWSSSFRSECDAIISASPPHHHQPSLISTRFQRLGGLGATLAPMGCHAALSLPDLAWPVA